MLEEQGRKGYNEDDSLMRCGGKHMDRWEDLFREHILERGKNYFYNGAVIQLQRTETGYQAVVEGAEEYEVEVETDGEQLLTI